MHPCLFVRDRDQHPSWPVSGHRAFSCPKKPNRARGISPLDHGVLRALISRCTHALVPEDWLGCWGGRKLSLCLWTSNECTKCFSRFMIVFVLCRVMIMISCHDDKRSSLSPFRSDRSTDLWWLLTSPPPVAGVILGEGVWYQAGGSEWHSPSTLRVVMHSLHGPGPTVHRRTMPQVGG